MFFTKGSSFCHKLHSNHSYPYSVFSKLKQISKLGIKTDLNYLTPILYQARQCHVLEGTKHDHSADKESEISFTNEKDRNSISKGPGLEYFLANSTLNTNSHLSKRQLEKISHPYIHPSDIYGHGKKVFFKVYGCQMNVNDADVAWSILKSNGFSLADTLDEADIILIVTCAIRESAETKVWRMLQSLRKMKIQKKSKVKIGVLGCMAERIGLKLVEKEKIVDVVAGPDSYKDLPRLLAVADEGEKTINVLLSHDETYANVNPVSIQSNKISAFVSIMRGCDNMCSYCIVPFTRGRERSRDIESILNEVRILSEQGIKEVTLLGQNVNSYRDTSENTHALDSVLENENIPIAKGFKTIYKPKMGGRRFADLLDKVSLINPEMRIRFTSPHPKDFPDEVLHIIKERPNICSQLHLPAQSGNSRVLALMKRGYTREVYLELISHIRSVIPSVYLSSDFICGFCSETEEEFEETLTLLKEVQYHRCFIFPYSLREKTSAHRKLEDDIPQEIKNSRLVRLHAVFHNIALRLNLAQKGQKQLALIEGFSKRSQDDIFGRNEGNIKVIIPHIELPVKNLDSRRHPVPGDYVEVEITDASPLVLKGTPLSISSMKEF